MCYLQRRTHVDSEGVVVDVGNQHRLSRRRVESRRWIIAKQERGWNLSGFLGKYYLCILGVME